MKCFVLRCAGVFSGGKVIAVLFVAFFSISPSFSQSYTWSVRLSSGEFFERVALDRLTADSLIITEGSGYSNWILIDKIAQLRKERSSAIVPATLIGGAGGAVMGYAARPTAKYQDEANIYSTAFGILVGAGVGYLVGSVVQPDEVIDLRQLDRQAKSERLQVLLQREQ